MKSIFRRLRVPRGRAWLAIPGLLLLVVAAGVREAPQAYAQPVGTVVVQKTLVDANGAPVQGNLSGFQFTISGGGGQSTITSNAQGQATIGVAPGTYTITEQPAPGAQLVGFFIGNTQIGSFQVTAGQTTTITATNRVGGTGTIQITKQIVDASGAVLTTVDRSGFQFTVTGSNGFTSTVTTDVNGAALVSNLGVATYTITEQPKAGFTFVSMTINGVPAANGGSVNLVAGQQNAVVVQNRQGGGNTVTVTKQIVDANGNPVSGVTVGGFQFTITCGTAFSQQATTDATGTATVANVPAGSCTITESVPSGFTVVSVTTATSTANIGNGGTFTVTAGQPTSITVRNRQGGATEQIQLFTGCNNVASTFPNGTATSTVAAGVSPSSALIAIWKFDNASQRFFGFSTLPNAPNDLTTLNRGDAIFICVNGSAMFTRPAL